MGSHFERGGWWLAMSGWVLGCAGATGSGPNTASPSPEGANVEPPAAAPATAEAQPPDADPIDCEPPQLFGPSLVSRADYDARHGAGATRFSEVPTTKERPLEECGLDDVLPRLATLVCDDGSQPYGGDPKVAHGFRSGNVGSGGRCGSIIDEYVAQCPEGEYRIHFDMYFCPKDGSNEFGLY